MQMKFIFQEESPLLGFNAVSKKTKAKEESECVVSEIIEVRVQINHLPRFRANEISFEKKAHKVSLFVFFEYCQTDFKTSVHR